MEGRIPNTRCRVCIDNNPNSPEYGEHVECKEIFMNATPRSVKFRVSKSDEVILRVTYEDTFCELKRRIMLVCPICLAYTVW